MSQYHVLCFKQAQIEEKVQLKWRKLNYVLAHAYLLSYWCSYDVRRLLYMFLEWNSSVTQLVTMLPCNNLHQVNF